MRDRSSPVKPSTGLSSSAGSNALFGVWSVSRAVSDLLNAALATSGLDADEFAVYSLLATEGAITPTELARWMAAPPTTVSSYVKRFEARGHVQRVPSPHDGRSYRVRLTPAGRRTHRAAAGLFTPTRARVDEALGDREPTVRAALIALREAVDEVRTRTAG